LSKLAKVTDKIPGLGEIKQRVEIDILRPTDHKGFTVNVDHETPVGFQMKAYGQDKYMVWKNGPGWSFKGYDKYLAIEGELLTSYIEKGETIPLTVPEFLKKIWPDGEAAYEAMRVNAPELVEPLENKKWATTVSVVTPEIAPGAGAILSVVKAQEILKDASLEIANSSARAQEKANPLSATAERIAIFAFGMVAMYFVQNALGWVT
jgi:hypothetical protein